MNGTRSASGRLRLASPLGPLRHFNLAHPKSLIYWARRFLASPGFSSLYIGTVVKAVGMWDFRTVFQRRWDGWKTLTLFSMLPTFPLSPHPFSLLYPLFTSR